MNGNQKNIPGSLLPYPSGRVPDPGGTPGGALMSEGATVQRLPDIFTNPETSIPVAETLPVQLCAGAILNPLEMAKIIEYEVPDGMKLIAQDIGLFFSDPAMIMNFDAEIRIDNLRMPAIIPTINRPCCCPWGNNQVIYGPKIVTLWGHVLAAGFVWSDYTAWIEGYLTYAYLEAEQRSQI